MTRKMSICPSISVINNSFEEKHHNLWELLQIQILRYLLLGVRVSSMPRHLMKRGTHQKHTHNKTCPSINGLIQFIRFLYFGWILSCGWACLVFTNRLSGYASAVNLQISGDKIDTHTHTRIDWDGKYCISFCAHNCINKVRLLPQMLGRRIYLFTNRLGNEFTGWTDPDVWCPMHIERGHCTSSSKDNSKYFSQWEFPFTNTLCA